MSGSTRIERYFYTKID